MTSVLKLPINLENGKNLTYSVQDPKTGLTKTEADAAMGYLVAESAINYGGYKAVGHGDAYLYNTEKIVLTD